MFHRRGRPDPALDGIRQAFARVAGMVEAAQRALLAAIPTSRNPGVPLTDALQSFRARLEDIAAVMPAWRAEPVVHEWTSCSDALAAARAEADRLASEPPRLGFEALNARIGDVLHPLETFADVERALRRR